MMKNKIKLKKYLMITFIFSICILILTLVLNIYEYKVYTKNYNTKIATIMYNIKQKYPEISENDIIKTLNGKDNENEMFSKYGIDINKDSIIVENENMHRKFLITNGVFFGISILILVIIFMKYNKDKDREIEQITKYIEEINKKNYSLHIDEISEDELSILKNEIYKTTVMLKENAENSLKDKKQLKKSLEDISHQLKTPLTSILVILDDLIEEPDMDLNTRQEFIRDIKREIGNINFFIQVILKLSKFDSNTINFMKEKIYVKDILEESIKNVSTLCDLRNIEIELYGDSKISLECDFRWQVEALSNIIKNCIDHSKDDGKIIIEYERNNVYVAIKIKDFGEGISSKDLPHIFERFYKGENSTSESIGIGLALAKTIIEQDNGNIDVESEIGKGATFTIKYF